MNDESTIKQLEAHINIDKDELDCLLDVYPDMPGNDFEFCIGHKLLLKGIGDFVGNLSPDTFHEKVKNYLKTAGHRRRKSRNDGKQLSKETLEPILVSGLQREFDLLDIPYPVIYHLTVNGM